MPLRAVFFDIGETLIDETRLWNRWAAYLGVSSEGFLAALREVIEAGQHHRRVFERFRPGFDIEAARQDRAARGDPDMFGAADLFPDAAPCLRALRRQGLVTGIAGNQPPGAMAALLSLPLEADIIGTSQEWGVTKPSPAFFARIAGACALPPAAIAYVGDRLDRDVLPARAAGMAAVFLERGPWGRAHARRPEVGLADLRLKTLADLPTALAALTD